MYIIKLVTSRCVVLKNSNPPVALRYPNEEEAKLQRGQKKLTVPL